MGGVTVVSVDFLCSAFRWFSAIKSSYIKKKLNVSANRNLAQTISVSAYYNTIHTLYNIYKITLILNNTFEHIRVIQNGIIHVIVQQF